MTSTRTMTSSHDIDGALRRGLSRFVGELTAGFEAIVEIFAEAGDGSTAARARFPSADWAHDPEKHALGLDPWVVFRFSEKIMLELKDPNQSARCALQ
jgi:hypothetical protein